MRAPTMIQIITEDIGLMKRVVDAWNRQFKRDRVMQVGDQNFYITDIVRNMAPSSYASSGNVMTVRLLEIFNTEEENGETETAIPQRKVEAKKERRQIQKQGHDN